MRTVLVAGATGMVGREAARLLRERGFRVRALSRDRERARSLEGIVDEIVTGDATGSGSLAHVIEGVDGVVSALGAPVALSGGDRRSFHDVDTVGNRNLIRAAREGGVKRFVYVSAYAKPGYAETAYIRAHENVVETLDGSGLSYGVVRPTGIFTSFTPYLAMASAGLISIPGDGTARTNPVHPTDVAEACVDAILQTGNVQLPVGGPEIMTRDEIARMTFDIVGKRPRIIHVPPPMFMAAAGITRRLHPRFGEIVEFVTRVFTCDCVAPQRGERTLREFLSDAYRRATSRS